MNTKAMIAGAVSGFVSAFLVDLHAWSSGTGPFDYKKAIGRWVGGAIAGAMAAAGFGSATA